MRGRRRRSTPATGRAESSASDIGTGHHGRRQRQRREFRRRGGSIPAVTASPAGPSNSRGRRRSAATKRAAKSRHQVKTGGKVAPASPAPRHQSPSPLPLSKASRRRTAIPASRSGASPLSSKTSLPRGVSRSAAPTRPGSDADALDPALPAAAIAGYRAGKMPSFVRSKTVRFKTSIQDLAKRV
jgi:hypothetical protein